MHTKTLAGLTSACLLAAGLSGCTTFGTGFGGQSANGTQVVSGIADAIKAINSSCTGTFATNITFAPPLPPVGNLNINQTCGLKQPAPADPATVPK